jgi:hypothetical protein
VALCHVEREVQLGLLAGTETAPNSRGAKAPKGVN